MGRGNKKHSASISPRIKPSVYVSLFVKFSLAFSSLAFATSFPLMHRFPPAFRVLLDLNLSNIKVWVIFFFRSKYMFKTAPYFASACVSTDLKFVPCFV